MDPREAMAGSNTTVNVDVVPLEIYNTCQSRQTVECARGSSLVACVAASEYQRETETETAVKHEQ